MKHHYFTYLFLLVGCSLIIACQSSHTPPRRAVQHKGAMTAGTSLAIDQPFGSPVETVNVPSPLLVDALNGLAPEFNLVVIDVCDLDRDLNDILIQQLRITSKYPGLKMRLIIIDSSESTEIRKLGREFKRKPERLKRSLAESTLILSLAEDSLPYDFDVLGPVLSKLFPGQPTDSVLATVGRLIRHTDIIEAVAIAGEPSSVAQDKLRTLALVLSETWIIP